MRVWITIGAVLDDGRNEPGTPVPASSLLAAVRAAGAAESTSCELVDGTAVRIEADSKEQLGDLAAAVAAWWRDEAPAGSGLMIGSPAGSSTTTFAVPDVLVRAVRGCIEEYAWPVDSAIPDAPSSVPRLGALRFTAHAVGVHEPGDEFEVLSVGVTEHADGDGLSLVFQGELESEPDEGYCLVSHTGACWYGGVTAVSLRDRRLRVALTREAARVLGLRPRITVHLAVDDAAVELLRDGLRRIFAASPGPGGPPRLDLG
jgi:Immunity protein 10